ncbi:Eukaryotic porin [Nitzschia inconspicua]|uniref:Eukaryotic porin n=1 Tax=Nitzschia inconspicua TaxID=303405 RepID=A0A9K3M0D7_9STRA|nr:Eukaryotic porin [Nitzschia inconspicua]
MGAGGSKSQQRSSATNFAVPPSPVSLFTSSSILSGSSLSSSSKTRCDDSTPPPPPPPPGGAIPPPPPPSSSDPSSQSLPIEDGTKSSSPEEDSIARAAAAASAFINPGPYEQAPQDLKRLVMLDTYDGFRCDINKQLSPYMAVVHSFWLGTNMIPDGRRRTYTWLTQVADETSLYMARVDPDRLSVDGRIHKALLGGLAMAKLQVGVSADGQSDQCLLDVDVNGPSWAGNFKYGSMGGGTVYGCSFHQGITPNLSMGGEGMYVSANGNMISSYMVKYSMPASGDPVDERTLGPRRPGAPLPDGPSSTFLAQFAPGSPSGLPLSLNYKRIVTPNRVTLGAELACDPFTLASNVMLGAEFKFSRSKLQVAVDGSAKIQSVLEAKLGKEPGQPSLTLCAEVDHLKDEMKFGYGLSIDG